MTRTVRELSKKATGWPEGEAIPTSLKEALGDGWEPYAASLYFDVLSKDIKNVKDYESHVDEWLRILLKKETEQFILHVTIDVSIGLSLECPPWLYQPRAYRKKSETPKPKQLTGRSAGSAS